jgi:hypothetical protein
MTSLNAEKIDEIGRQRDEFKAFLREKSNGLARATNVHCKELLKTVVDFPVSKAYYSMFVNSCFNWRTSLRDEAVRVNRTREAYEVRCKSIATQTDNLRTKDLRVRFEGRLAIQKTDADGYPLGIDVPDIHMSPTQLELAHAAEILECLQLLEVHADEGNVDRMNRAVAGVPGAAAAWQQSVRDGVDDLAVRLHDNRATPLFNESWPLFPDFNPYDLWVKLNSPDFENKSMLAICGLCDNDLVLKTPLPYVVREDIGLGMSNMLTWMFDSEHEPASRNNGVLPLLRVFAHNREHMWERNKARHLVRLGLPDDYDDFQFQLLEFWQEIDGICRAQADMLGLLEISDEEVRLLLTRQSIVDLVAECILTNAGFDQAVRRLDEHISVCEQMRDRLPSFLSAPVGYLATEPASNLRDALVQRFVAAHWFKRRLAAVRCYVDDFCRNTRMGCICETVLSNRTLFVYSSMLKSSDGRLLLQRAELVPFWDALASEVVLRKAWTKHSLTWDVKGRNGKRKVRALQDELDGLDEAQAKRVRLAKEGAMLKVALALQAAFANEKVFLVGKRKDGLYGAGEKMRIACQVCAAMGLSKQARTDASHLATSGHVLVCASCSRREDVKSVVESVEAVAPEPEPDAAVRRRSEIMRKPEFRQAKATRQRYEDGWCVALAVLDLHATFKIESLPRGMFKRVVQRLEPCPMGGDGTGRYFREPKDALSKAFVAHLPKIRDRSVIVLSGD